MLDRTGKRVLIVVAPLVVLLWILANVSFGPPPGPLYDIPPRALARVAKHWDGWPNGMLNETYSWETENWTSKWESGPVANALRAAGPDGPRILLRLILDDETERFGVTTGSFWRDETGEPLGAWLAAHPDPRIEPDLLALARDPTRHPEVRRTAIIALCRPGNMWAMENLADLALDPAENINVRRAILYRLHRIGTPPPVRLHDLLYVPFQGIDRTAAAALGACGDSEATSLVLDLLAGPPDGDFDNPSSDQVLAAKAAAELTSRGDEEIRHVVSIRTEDQELIPEALARLAEHLREWCASDPARTDTAFERDRREYLASDRRLAELRQLATPVAELARMPEDEIDLGAAALAAFPFGGPDRRRLLEGLHRLAILVGTDLAGDETPEETLAVLARRLTPERVPVMPMHLHHLRSWLSVVLREGWGDGVGLSLLYLAVAERLSLPLRMVMAGDEALVRWDDGETRADVDPHEFGALRAESSGESLTRREVLGVVLARAAAQALEKEKYEWARDAADAAIELRPAESAAFTVRALANFHLTSAVDDEVIADLRHAGSPVLLAETLQAMGRHAEALVEWDRVVAESPGFRRARVEHARCRIALGDRERAFSELRALTAEVPDSPHLAHLRLELLARVGDPAWREGLAGIEEPADRPIAHLAVAGALLERREPDVEAALTVLREISAFGEKSWEDIATIRGSEPANLRETLARRTLQMTVGQDSYGDLQRRYFLLLAKATLATGDREEARRLLHRAEGSGGHTRQTRLLRRELDRK